MSSKAQGPVTCTHRCLFRGSSRILLWVRSVVAADFHIFHYCGKFLVRFLGTELDLVASGHQTGLRRMKLHGACYYNQVFPRCWDALAERV